jgi:iron complex outermembrane receptor protein
LTKDLTTPGLSGTYTLNEALDALLSGTGLGYKVMEDGRAVAIILAQADDGVRSDAGAEALPPIDVGAEANDAARTVDGGRGGRGSKDSTAYRASNAISATKTDTPIMETPTSIQVVPQQVLQDQQITRLSRALEYVSGVNTGAEGQGQLADLISIRGFQTYFYYRDGVRSHSGQYSQGLVNTANIDKLEVLKGPASILYGRTEPGGIINVVTKQPQATPHYAIQQQFQSYGFYRTTVDATGPLTEDDRLLYRMNLSYENSHTNVDFSGKHNIFIAPVLRWNIDASTQATFYLDYNQFSYPVAITGLAFTTQDVGSLIFGARPISFLPRGRSFTDPWSRGEADNLKLGVNWSHAFDENWSLTHRFQAEFSNLSEYDDVVTRLVTSTQLGKFAAAVPAQHTHSYFTNLDLAGKIDTFGLEHKVLVGGDFQHFDKNLYIIFPYYPRPNMDVFTPIHSNIRPGFDPASRFDLADQQNWYGFYAQDQVRLPHNFHLLAGVRYDHADTYDVVSKRTFDNSQRVTPRFGLLWRPIPEVSVYGSYQTNFGGSNIFGRRPLPPETAQQWEVGVKTEMFDSRLTTTLSYYYLLKQNIATPDPNPILAAQGYSVATGEVRHKGVELDVAGEILPGWRVIGAYSYIDSLITKDRGLDYNNLDADGNPAITAGNTGNRLINVPRHNGSIWSTYELQKGDWRGLKLGGGVVARSIRQGDNANDFQLPGYATVGLMASYDWIIDDKKLRVQLNVDNLLDTRYYPFSYGNAIGGVYAGAPRTFRGAIGVEF